jgi:hypothetical protein
MDEGRAGLESAPTKTGGIGPYGKGETFALRWEVVIIATFRRAGVVAPYENGGPWRRGGFQTRPCAPGATLHLPQRRGCRHVAGG